MFPLKTTIITKNADVRANVQRELENLSGEINHCFPDINSTIEGINLNSDEMHFFIVHLESADDLTPLKHLHGIYMGRPILVLLDNDPSASSIVHAMREGATQVVLLPFAGADLREALCSIEMQFGHMVGKSRVIAVTGSHGGPGATTISVNLAYEIAQTFKTECILMELTTNVGVFSSYLNIEPEFSCRDLLEMGKQLDVHALKDALVPFGDRLSVLAGPIHAAVDFQPTRFVKQRLIHCARQMADVVVLDVPSTLDSEQLDVLDVADVVLLVTEQTVPSIQMTSELLRLGIRAKKPVIILNKFDPKLIGFDVKHLARILSADDSRTVSDDHVSVTASVNMGQPLRMTVPQSPVLRDIDHLAEDLLGEHEHEPSHAGLLRSLIRSVGASLTGKHHHH